MFLFCFSAIFDISDQSMGSIRCIARSFNRTRRSVSGNSSSEEFRSVSRVVGSEKREARSEGPNIMGSNAHRFYCRGLEESL
jgi:hypothetical protein